MAARPHSPDTAASDGFRRRFPLELTPAECELLEHQGRRLGTKRAALLAGLQALQERDELAQRIERLQADNQAARAELAEREKAIAKLERQLAKATKDARAGQTASRAAARREQRAREQADDRADIYADALREERELNAQLESELTDLRECAVDALYCHRCGAWVEPDEWAHREDEDADLLYHRGCGFHRGTGFTQTSVLARRYPPSP